MTFSRLALGLLVAGVVALNANAAADASANQTNAAADNSAKPMAIQHATKAKKAKVAAAKIDINSADQAALAKIKGIGEKKAKAIVEYRTKNGPLASLQDLKNITNAKGKAMFNAKSIQRLAQSVTVGGQQAAASAASSSDASANQQQAS